MLVTNLAAAAAAESKPPIEAVATQTAEAAAPEARSQDSLAHHWMPPSDSVHKRIYMLHVLHKN